MRTRVRATAGNTFIKQKQKVWSPPNPSPDTPGTQSTQICTKQSKDKHKKSPPPRRRVDPDRPYATGARARSPTDSARRRGQKSQAQPLAQLAEKAIIEPKLMVVLQEEAEKVHGDGRGEACGAREAVLA